MAAKNVPWWRNLISVALRGVRARVTAFLRPTKSRPAEEPAVTMETREEEALTEQSPNPVPQSEPANAEKAEASAQEQTPAVTPEPVPDQVLAADDPEAPEIEAVEAASEPVVESVYEGPRVAEPAQLQEFVPIEEPASPPDSIEETVLAPEEETAQIASEPDLDIALEAASEEESIAREPEPAQPEDEPAVSTDAQEIAPVEAPVPHAVPVKAAAPAKEAPQPIKREEGPENSPFSVIVSQVYEGPMDLLLDLIRKQDIDIYNIPIAKITGQFLTYVNHLRASDMDVAGEFIYTASLLIHIKSKMLLPREPSGPDDAQEDPRRELVERLLEHERFKNAAQMLQQKQMLEDASWTNPGVREFVDDVSAEPEIAADTVDLVRIFREILDRARNRPILNLEEDSVTVGQMIQFLSRRLTMEDKPVALRRLLSHTKSERALIAMFLALLELVRLQAILLRQDLHFSEIFIKKNSGFDAVMDQGQIRDDWQ
jgi:segregation and condensation protein A